MSETLDRVAQHPAQLPSPTVVVWVPKPPAHLPPRQLLDMAEPDRVELLLRENGPDSLGQLLQGLRWWSPPRGTGHLDVPEIHLHGTCRLSLCRIVRNDLSRTLLRKPASSRGDRSSRIATHQTKKDLLHEIFSRELVMIRAGRRLRGSTQPSTSLSFRQVCAVAIPFEMDARYAVPFPRTQDASAVHPLAPVSGGPHRRT